MSRVYDHSRLWRTIARAWDGPRSTSAPSHSPRSVTCPTHGGWTCSTEVFQPRISVTHTNTLCVHHASTTTRSCPRRFQRCSRSSTGRAAERCSRWTPTRSFVRIVSSFRVTGLRPATLVFHVACIQLSTDIHDFSGHCDCTTRPDCLGRTSDSCTVRRTSWVAASLPHATESRPVGWRTSTSRGRSRT